MFWTLRSHDSPEQINTSPIEGKSGDALYIMGPMKVQNCLMASYLEQAMGVRCAVIESVSEIPPTTANTSDGKGLVLLDQMGCSQGSPPADLPKGTLVCLFNLDPNSGVEEKCVTKGVKGFFYLGDSLEQLLSGVQAVLRGELWLSKEIMTRYILNNQGRRFPLKSNPGPRLTPREREILILISEGAAYLEIAEKLFISRHTLKTHIYHLYKKIKATSRSQAVSWANKNL